MVLCGCFLVRHIFLCIVLPLYKKSIHNYAAISFWCFNFYAIIMILVSIGITIFNLKFDSVVNRISNIKDDEEGQKHGHEQCEFEEKMQLCPLLMPIAILLAVTSNSSMPLETVYLG